MSEFGEALAIGQKFNQEAIGQLDNRIIGEANAKQAMRLAIVTGQNVVLAGVPAIGKTELASEAYKLVEGIEEENVARVPHSADLTGKRLIGGSVKTETETYEEGVVKNHTQTTKIDAIIHKDSQVIWIDELSRVNPWALNDALDAFENRRITNDSGVVALDGLLYAVSTMNPSENKQATFKIADAMASRHAIGAIMGDKDNADEQEAILNGLFNGFEPKEIQSVITLKELDILRGTKLALPENLRKLAKELVTNSVKVLADHEIEEGTPRFFNQVKKNANGLALMNGSQTITEAELLEATKFTIGGRIATKGSPRRSRGTGLNTVLNDIVTEVTK